jgi:hypothetical protein
MNPANDPVTQHPEYGRVYLLYVRHGNTPERADQLARE